MEYVQHHTFWGDMRLIYQTIFSRKSSQAPLPNEENMPDGIHLK